MDYNSIGNLIFNIMNPVSFTYQKAFAIGPFLQEKIGVEFQLNDGESPEDGLYRAKDLVEAWHKTANPHLFQDPSGVEKNEPETSWQEGKDIFRIAAPEDAEFIAIRTTLVEILEYEKAAAFLSKSNFKYHVELKAIVESKKPNE